MDPSVPRLRSLAVLLALATWLCLPHRALATPRLPSTTLAALWAGPAPSPQPQRTPSSPVGTLPGRFEVDPNGAANFTIPLELPAAARGLEPALGLAYTSQSGDGPLGVGWALSGQSAITRCAHTLADDGELAPVRMDPTDALCLDGARLELMAGAALEAGASYRPRRDDLSRATMIAGSEDGATICASGLGFEVRRHDGTIATYGCERDAIVEIPLGVHTWALSSVRDRFGNSVAYHYSAETLDGADAEHRLSSIAYGAHAELHAPTRQVRINWEPRPDPAAGYFLGAPQRSSKRIASIDTYAPHGLGARYLFDYAAPSVTQRSLLAVARGRRPRTPTRALSELGRERWPVGGRSSAHVPTALSHHSWLSERRP